VDAEDRRAALGGKRSGVRLRSGAALLLLAGCAHASHARSASVPKEAPGAIDYSFRVDPSLGSIDARVCWKGRAPSELVSGVRWGGDYLRRASTRTPAGERALPVVGHRIVLASLPRDGCAAYTIDLDAAASSGRFDAARRGDALVSNIALWLWRPLRWQELRELSARIELPAGMQASLPWPRRGERYVLDHSALAFHAFAVFGHFEVERIEVPGATIEVAILEGLSPDTRAHVVPWLEQAARAVALPFGRFPRADAQVVVIPTAPSAEPVRFGTMNRGGGASAAMLLPANAELQPLLHDWVAVHEFSHLLAPFIERDDAWLSEGLATYYQEVLRVRTGMELEQDAWRRLYEGSLLGRDAKHSLAEQSADMFRSFSFKLVYWAGASFALMGDVELRRRTHGRLSLDQVMAELAASADCSQRSFTAREVIERLDRIAGAPIFSDLMKRWVHGPTLPDLDALYGRLGLAVGADGVQMSAGSEDSWIREAIMHGEGGRAAPPLASTKGLGGAP
jgi:hypothetical protein